MIWPWGECEQLRRDCTTLNCEKPQKRKPGHLHIECRFHCLSSWKLFLLCFNLRNNQSTQLFTHSPLMLVLAREGLLQRYFLSVYTLGNHGCSTAWQTDKPAFSIQETREWPGSYGGTYDSEQGCVAWTPTRKVQFCSEGRAKQNRPDRRRAQSQGLSMWVCCAYNYSLVFLWCLIDCFK